jgi:hypothetical protein
MGFDIIQKRFCSSLATISTHVRKLQQRSKIETLMLNQAIEYVNKLCHRPDDGGGKDLWNVGKLLPDYTALQPRRQPLRTHRRENLKSYLNCDNIKFSTRVQQ